jgi:hypothetical protein
VRPVTAALDGSAVAGDTWACLAVRRSAFEQVGGIAGSSVPGRAEKTSFTSALEGAGWAIHDEPAAVVLALPDGT